MSQRTSIESSLIRAVGVWGLAASIVNLIIGGGIFRIPSDPAVAGLLGAAAPLAYLVCALAMGLVVLCMAEAGSRVSLTGGPYMYVETAFGPYAGFLVGVLIWSIGATAVPAISMIYVDNFARVVPGFASEEAKLALLVGTYAIVVWINVRGVKQGTRLIGAATIVKLAPLLLLIAVGVFGIHTEYLKPVAMPPKRDFARAAMVLVFVFAGFESALVPSGEVRDSSRTVPRALLLAMGLVTVLFIALQLVVQGILGPHLVGSPTPLADAAQVVMGGWGARLFAVAVVLSTFGFMTGMALAMPRALFAFARDGYAPRVLASVHPRFHTPHVAIIAQAVLTVVLAATGAFERLVVLANLAALLAYLGCCAAAFELHRRDVRGTGEPFRLPGGNVIPILAGVLVIALLSSVTAREWRFAGLVLAVASLVFVTTRRARAERAASPTAAS
ncbi:MAG TPA: APC family permease [Gemmatimonadaceae bacterium]|nr:APC family permease [Gemmatimonadaceae bacterium]